MPPLLAFHVAAGTVGVLSGAAVFVVRKGTRLHRRVGLVFAASMLAMAASGAAVAAFLRPSPLNLVAGLFTFYLVATGWRAGRRGTAAADGWDAAALAFALLVAAVGLTGGTGSAVFGSAALLFAASDVRLLARGGAAGAPRLARHLWRMGLAFWIAVASLFLGNARVFPAAVRSARVLPVPVLAVALLVLFWLVKVRFARTSSRAAYRHSPSDSGVSTSTTS